MISWFAKNGVAANLLMISILAGGIFCLIKLIPLEAFPSYEKNKVINIEVSFRGATPEDIEKGITIRIEEAIQGLNGIKDITSTSSEDTSSVTIEVASGHNPRDLLADIKGRVDAINTFPNTAEKPVITLEEERVDVILVTLSSIYSEKETREFAEMIRNDILQIQGISQALLIDVRNFEITIEISQDKLLQYGLNIADISQAIRQSSTDISSGNLRAEGGDVLIRTKGQAYSKNEFSTIPIRTNKDGSILRLEEISTIHDGFDETHTRTRFNGKTAVSIEVYQVGAQSTIAISEKVRRFIDKKQSSLPQGYDLNYWDDDSLDVVNRLSTLTNSAVQGGLLVLLILALFLRPAIAIWVFIGIPISFAGALLVLPLFDITLNIFSLFGFVLVLGIVVDDAIVTGENIYTHLQKSESGIDAAINGTKEISLPVTFGILTTIAAFSPLFFIEGDRSDLFNQIPYVVIPVLLFSLIESKLILPSHLKHIKLRRQTSNFNIFERFQHKFADGLESKVTQYYLPLLKSALQYKLTVLSIFTAFLIIISSLFSSGWMKFTFFPRIPSETLSSELVMPAGTSFNITSKYITHITDQANNLKKKYQNIDSGQSIILNTLTTIDETGGHIEFEIAPPEKRELKISSQELLNEWRELTGDIPGATSLSYSAEYERPDYPINVQLSGASVDSLSSVADSLKTKLRSYSTVFDISDNLTDGKEELLINLTDQGRALGFTRQNVLSQIRDSIFGSEVQRIQRGRDDVRIMVRLPINERNSVAKLNELLIFLPSGQGVPIAQIATLTPTKGPSTIQRVNRFRAVNVTADLEKTNTNMAILEADLTEFLKGVLAQHPDVSYSFEGEAKEQREAFSSLSWSLLAMLFIIYSLLAIPFKSYLQPLIVMSVIPFGIIGAVMGHWLLGMNLTLLSLLGMLALIGVIVNDSLVLVDYINKKRESVGLYQAVLSSGTARFRPIILTSLTTFIGLLPLLFEQSTQAQFLIPMAVSLGFGILFSTMITLFIVPINYILLDQVCSYFKSIRISNAFN